MRIFPNVLSFIKNNVPILNTILMVIIIGQLIAYFNIKLINNTIIPVAYLVSIWLLYKTLQARQKTNLFESGKQVFEIQKEEIKNIIHNLEKADVSEYEIKVPNRTVRIKSNEILGIYNRIYAAIKIIQTEESFIPYIEKIKNHDKSILENNEIGFRNLVAEYRTIYLLLNNLHKNITGFRLIYERILTYKNSLTSVQINLLITEIDKYLEEYYKICKDILDKRKEINTDVIIEIRTIATNIIDNLNMIINNRLITKLYSGTFLDHYNRIDEIKKLLTKP